MPVLILPPRYTEDSIAMYKAASARGWDVARLERWRAPAELADHDPVLYGEPLFAAAVAEQLGLAMLEPEFAWLASLPPSLRKREVRFATLAEGRMHFERAFFKPADDKCFRAAVYGSGRELPPPDVLPDNTPILIAEVVPWAREFRCFLLKGELAAISPYLRDGELARAADGSWPMTDDEGRACRDTLAALHDAAVAIPPAVVVDIGEIAGRGWAVVEANPAWGSGLYGCDPEAVLAVIRRACVPARACSAADRRWVIDRTAA